MDKKRLTEIMVIESPRVRVEIFYDNLISTIEAKETAVKLIHYGGIEYGKGNIIQK
ncbi:unnamed protein product [marine sediment metagenome]|uniref:Uncharacterized protein n=1 Tax=marine sediment metagenome TaxID=412755 RepID=X0UTF0_9ZZZZ